MAAITIKPGVATGDSSTRRFLITQKKKVCINRRVNVIGSDTQFKLRFKTACQFKLGLVIIQFSKWRSSN